MGSLKRTLRQWFVEDLLASGLGRHPCEQGRTEPEKLTHNAAVTEASAELSFREPWDWDDSAELCQIEAKGPVFISPHQLIIGSRLSSGRGVTLSEAISCSQGQFLVRDTAVSQQQSEFPQLEDGYADPEEGTSEEPCVIHYRWILQFLDSLGTLK